MYKAIVFNGGKSVGTITFDNVSELATLGGRFCYDWRFAENVLAGRLAAMVFDESQESVFYLCELEIDKVAMSELLRQ